MYLIGVLACLLLGRCWHPSSPSSPNALAPPHISKHIEMDVPSLMRYATLIVPQKPVGDTHLEWNKGYQWLSDHQLIMMRLLPASDERPRIARFVLYDVRTHQERNLAPVDKRLDTSAEQINHWQLSPNKQWLLVQTRDFINILHLDGTSYYKQLDNGEWNRIYWLDSARHLFSACPRGEYNPSLLTDESLEYPTLQRYTVPELRPAGRMTNTARNPLVLARASGLSSLAVTQRNDTTFLSFNVPSLDYSNKVTTTAHILMRDWKRKRVRSQSVSMRLPFPGRVATAVFSPNAKQVAYTLLRASGKKQDKSEDKFDGTLEVWVTTWSTGASRFVGSVPCVFSDSGYEEDQYPSCLQWLPGGSRLSFVYKDALWTTSINAR